MFNGLFRYLPIVFLIVLLFWLLAILYFFFTLIVPRYFMYRYSNYQKESGMKFWKIVLNRGYWGEFRIFFELEKYKGYKRILTNLYLDKGHEKTEIDVVMVDSNGIHVFESKNLRGKIYGNEKNKNWVQYLYGKKSTFFNPIKQNQVHIKALKETLHLNSPSLYSSYIVFGVVTDIRKVSEPLSDVKVTKGDQVLSTVLKKQLGMQKMLQTEHIDAIYHLLKKYTKATDEVKRQHINTIQEKYETN